MHRLALRNAGRPLLAARQCLPPLVTYSCTHARRWCSATTSQPPPHVPRAAVPDGDSLAVATGTAECDLTEVIIAAPALDEIDTEEWHLVTQGADSNLVTATVDQAAARNLLGNFGAFGVRVPLADDGSEDRIQLWAAPKRMGWSYATARRRQSGAGGAGRLGQQQQQTRRRGAEEEEEDDGGGDTLLAEFHSRTLVFTSAATPATLMKGGDGDEVEGRVIVDNNVVADDDLDADDDPHPMPSAQLKGRHKSRTLRQRSTGKTIGRPRSTVARERRTHRKYGRCTCAVGVRRAAESAAAAVAPRIHEPSCPRSADGVLRQVEAAQNAQL